MISSQAGWEHKGGAGFNIDPSDRRRRRVIGRWARRLIEAPGLPILVVSARRCEQIVGEDEYRYMAIYEFESEERLREFLDSDHLVELKAEYDANFGNSGRQRLGLVQVWP